MVGDNLDPAGNMTTRAAGQGSQQLTWNDAGQLTAITGGTAGNSSFECDADGSLLIEKDPGVTTLCLPGEQISLNTATQALSGTRYYPLPGGGTAYRTGTGTAYGFEITDQHGTPVLALDSTAQVPVWRQFTPFGAPRGAPVTWIDNRAFLDKPADPATSLTIVGARSYDPVAGRFISDDPLLETTSPQQLNGYAYAADNPTTGADPSGEIMINTGGCVGSIQFCEGGGGGGGSLGGGSAGGSSGTGASGGGSLCFHAGICPQGGTAPIFHEMTSTYPGGLTAVIAGFADPFVSLFDLSMADTPGGILDAATGHTAEAWYRRQLAAHGVDTSPDSTFGGGEALGISTITLATLGMGGDGALEAAGITVNLSTAARTSDEAAAISEYASRSNAWLSENGPRAIQSTDGALRAEANAAARTERLAAARAGTPYAGQVGHVPDTAITGQANPPGGWLDMPGCSNQVCGGVLGSRIGQLLGRFTVDGELPP